MKNALYATGLAVLLALTMSACSKKPAPPATPSRQDTERPRRTPP